MKEIYLAMDWNNLVFGYSNAPVLENGTWGLSVGSVWHSGTLLTKFGIDVTKFPISHETPIKIRAVWEVVE